MNPENERMSQTEFLHSIEGFFQERSIVSDGLWALVVFAGIAGIFFLGWWLQRRKTARRTSNPIKLFRTVLRDLDLPVPQRDVIVRIAQNAKLEHPLSLLICHQLYRTHAAEWLEHIASARGEKVRKSAEERVAHAEENLFWWIQGDNPSGQIDSPSH
jgi:hypothetical protein